MKTLLIGVIVGATIALTGCVVAPPSYGYGYQPGPVYAPPVVVAPVIGFGWGWGGGWHGGGRR